MKEKEEILYEATMEDLQSFWEVNEELLRECHSRRFGMRSSQIACLVLFLIKKGVIK